MKHEKKKAPITFKEILKRKKVDFLTFSKKITFIN